MSHLCLSRMILDDNELEHSSKFRHPKMSNPLLSPTKIEIAKRATNPSLIDDSLRRLFPYLNDQQIKEVAIKSNNELDSAIKNINSEVLQCDGATNTNSERLQSLQNKRRTTQLQELHEYNPSYSQVNVQRSIISLKKLRSSTREVEDTSSSEGIANMISTGQNISSNIQKSLYSINNSNSNHQSRNLSQQLSQASSLNCQHPTMYSFNQNRDSVNMNQEPQRVEESDFELNSVVYSILETIKSCQTFDQVENSLKNSLSSIITSSLNKTSELEKKLSDSENEKSTFKKSLVNLYNRIMSDDKSKKDNEKKLYACVKKMNELENQLESEKSKNRLLNIQLRQLDQSSFKKDYMGIDPSY